MKRFLASLCAAALLLGLLLVGTASADEIEIYLVAENDKMANLSADAMPAWIDGTMYVPYLVFDRLLNQVDLGVSYGQTRTDTEYKLTLYSLSGTLVFDMNKGTCTNGQTGEDMDMKAVLRNGRPYVPLAAVCRFFGLSYTYTPTTYGTLIRITNGQESLDTQRFVEAATNGAMRTRYYKYLQELGIDQATPSPTPAATPSASNTPGPQGGQVSFAILVGGGGSGAAMADVLEQYGVRGLFLFTTEELAEQDELVRRLAGSGHAVGLAVSGETTEQALEELEQGSALLEQIAHLRTHTAYLTKGGSGVSAQLKSEGWACWSADIDARPDGGSQYDAILKGVEGRRSRSDVLLDDSGSSASALGRALSKLWRDEYRFPLAVETEF